MTGQDIIGFFSNLEQRPLERMVFLVSGLLVFWMLEGAFPLMQLKFKKGRVRHAMVNLLFTAMHLAIHTFLAIGIVVLSDYCQRNEFGIVHWTNSGVAATIIITFLTLDFFGGWLVHIIEHKLKWLWRFHLVHHADNNVDVTTGLRHHPVESVLRGLFFYLGIAVCGAPMYAVMIFQTILVLATAFTHANVSLPARLDNFLSYFLVSPNMHKVHHHWKQPYTDSNYGAVLSIWDRLLGTFMRLHPQHIRYGIDRHYPNERDEDVGHLMVRPFQQLESHNLE